MPVLQNDKEYSLKIFTLSPGADSNTTSESYTSTDTENTIEVRSVSIFHKTIERMVIIKPVYHKNIKQILSV